MLERKEKNRTEQKNMKLYVGFESTWSIRAWLCSQIGGVECETHVLALKGENFKSKLFGVSETGLIPALETDGIIISDSLAIAEFLNEKSNGLLYPSDSVERSMARSLTCEMHSGFSNLRNDCPFSTGAVEPMNISPNIKRELERLEYIFSKAQIPFMFSGPTIVDAFYSVLAYRLKIYGIHLSSKAGEYQKTLISWPLFQKALLTNTEWGRRA